MFAGGYKRTKETGQRTKESLPCGVCAHLLNTGCDTQIFGWRLGIYFRLKFVQRKVKVSINAFFPTSTNRQRPPKHEIPLSALYSKWLTPSAKYLTAVFVYRLETMRLCDRWILWTVNRRIGTFNQDRWIKSLDRIAGSKSAYCLPNPRNEFLEMKTCEIHFKINI